VCQTDQCVLCTVDRRWSRCREMLMDSAINMSLMQVAINADMPTSRAGFRSSEAPSYCDCGALPPLALITSLPIYLY